MPHAVLLDSPDERWDEVVWGFVQVSSYGCGSWHSRFLPYLYSNFSRWFWLLPFLSTSPLFTCNAAELTEVCILDIMDYSRHSHGGQHLRKRISMPWHEVTALSDYVLELGLGTEKCSSKQPFIAETSDRRSRKDWCSSRSPYMRGHKEKSRVNSGNRIEDRPPWNVVDSRIENLWSLHLFVSLCSTTSTTTSSPIRVTLSVTLYYYSAWNSLNLAQ